MRNRRVNTALMIGLLLLICSPLASGQNTDGRWLIGFGAGVNAWVNDFNEHPIAVGFDVGARYGFTPALSLGISTGYQILKGNQNPAYPGFYEYLRLEGIPVSLFALFHLTPGQRLSVSLSAGAGALIYQRKYHTGETVPDGKGDVSLLIPFGLIVEYPLSNRVGLSANLNYQIASDNTDLFIFQSPDAILGLKLGLNFYVGESSSDDDDNDGLTNGEELRVGTNPKISDSDNDGLSDGEEVLRFRTDPLKADTDIDGLNDGDEIRLYKTSPAKGDTDGDGLSDGDEILRYNTDPLKSDTDGDGVPDGQEVQLNTDPWKSDSDGDGLSDWDEVNLHKTSPTLADTDGDGLTDRDELKKYFSNPLKPDTDGGGVTDGVEVARGTNPLLAYDDLGRDQIVLERGKSVVLEGVTFFTGSASLTFESAQTLEKAFNALRSNPSLQVDIIGYTDNTGSMEVNRRISLQRAEAVRSWLVQRGISSGRLIVSGRGPENPIATNQMPEGRAKNRRIEFLVR